MIQLERNALVWGIVGNLGGGKSLSAVDIATRSMGEGYFVCSNITLDIDRICKCFGSHCKKLYKHISLDDPDFDPFKLPTGSPRGSGGKKRVLVILDECAEWIDQYSSAKDERIKRLWSWLRHSSKRSQDVFIVCQRREYINKVIRILIARWIWVDDLAVWRCPVIKMRLPFCKGLVAQNVFDRQGSRIGSMSFVFKSFVGQFYNTAECLNAEGATLNYEYETPERYTDFPLWLFLFWLCSFIYIILNM